MIINIVIVIIAIIVSDVVSVNSFPVSGGGGWTTATTTADRAPQQLHRHWRTPQQAPRRHAVQGCGGRQQAGINHTQEAAGGPRPHVPVEGG